MRVTLTQVRKLHDAYAGTSAKWGEDNMATSNAMVRYWEARSAYEAQTGKKYVR